MYRKSATAASVPRAETLSPAFKTYLVWTAILFGRPQDFLTFLEPVRIALVFTVLVLATILFGRRSLALDQLLGSGISRKFALLYLIMILGIPFADHRSRAFSWTFTVYLANVLFFYISLFHLDSVKKVRLTALVLCCSALFYGLLGLVMGHFAGGRLSFGSMYDPNDLAFYMVGLFPISILFLVTANSMRTRLLAAAVLGIAPLVIILTGSRGGLLSLSIVLAIMFLTRLGGLKRSYKAVILLIVAVGVSIFFQRINVARYDTLFGLEDDYNITSETGRISVWKTGFKLIAAHPFTGVGASCFPRAFGYLRAAEGRTPIWRAAHSAYIQIWAELGYPGIIVFLALIYGTIRKLKWVYRQKAPDSERTDLKLLSGLLLIGLWASLFGGLFLSQAYSLQFTLFFAMAATLEKLSRNALAAPQTRESMTSGPVGEQLN